jgi:putative ABC transport system permease protein
MDNAQPDSTATKQPLPAKTKSLNLLLPLKMVWRDWRGGELLIMGTALMLAVAVITTIALLTDRIQRAFITQSQSFLAAQSVIQSSRPIPEDWIQQAHQRELSTATLVQFPTMIQHQERFQLASVKAVSPAYPLKGHLEIQTTGSRSEKPTKVDQGPAPGHIWVESHLMQLLDLKLGDSLTLGNATFKVSALLEQEPDRGLSFINIGARVMMHLEDVPATELIQPGSRIRHRLLLSGDETGLSSFLETLKAKLTDHERILTLDDESPRIAQTLKRAEGFLYLSGSLSVILACVAISLSCRRYTLRHTAYVAVIKSLGTTQGQTFRLYLIQVLALSLLGTLIGLILAWLLQALLSEILIQALHLEAPPARLWPLLLGGVAGSLCTLGFALPPLWQLSKTSPMQSLQQDWGNPSGTDWLNYIAGPLCLLSLIAGLTQDSGLTLSLTAGLCMLVALARITCLYGLNPLSRALSGWHPRWRLVAGSLERRSGFNTLILAAFSAALLALSTLFYTRTSLLEEWRLQIPEKAPNHFLVNITPFNVEDIRAFLKDQQLDSLYFYPTVRARVTAINGTALSEWPKKDHEAIRRELNLSWTDTLPLANRIEAGRWWQPGDKGVSVEQDMADKLGIELGDRITFSVGGLPYETQVLSLRSLSWDTMTPNFYMLFAPGNLDEFPKAYIGSFYLPSTQKALVVALIKQYPTVSVIELDKIIARIQNTIAQVSIAVEGILGLILVAGILVLISGVRASITERLHEAALIRALGASKYLIQSSVAGEFILIGICSGLMAAVGTELALASISHFALNLPLKWHLSLWIGAPLLGGALIGIIGTLSCRPAIAKPPIKVLLQAT